MTGQRSLAEIYAKDVLSEVVERAILVSPAMEIEGVLVEYGSWYRTPSFTAKYFEVMRE